MKQLMLLLVFCALGALTTVNAQTVEGKKECSSMKSAKSCCAAKAQASADGKACCAKGTSAMSEKSCHGAKVSTASVSEDVSPAIKAAAADESIETRTCAKSGNVTFYKKSTCPFSGNVSYSEVQYDEVSGQFVSQETPKEAHPVGKEKAATFSKDAKASSM